MLFEGGGEGGRGGYVKKLVMCGWFHVWMVSCGGWLMIA